MESEVSDLEETHFAIYKRNIEKQVSSFCAWAPTLDEAHKIVEMFKLEHYYIIQTTSRRVEWK